MVPYEDQVLNALADSMAGIDGLSQSAYLVSNPSTPQVEILPGEIEFDKAFQRGNDDWYCTVRLTIGAKLDAPSQRKLRAFRDPSGPQSIKASIETDRTLGGLVDNLRVTKCSPMRQFRRPDGQSMVLGCDFEVAYTASGLKEAS